MKKSKIIYTSVFGFIFMTMVTGFNILAKKKLTLLFNFIFKIFYLWFINFLLPVGITMLIGYGVFDEISIIQPVISIILIFMLYVLGCVITNRLVIWKENNL